MENRMRDLEHIQERSPEERGHRIGTVLLAALTVVGFTFAMGVVVGRAAQPDQDEAEDPLAKLDGSSGLRALDNEDDEGKALKVKREELTFHTALTEEDERPEVEAALAAAAEEEADLNAFALTPAAPTDLEPRPEPEPKTEVEPQIPAVLPAAVGAGNTGRVLARTAKHDPLVSAAIVKPKNTEPAPAGGDGEFTLQVISYDRAEPAHAFAKGLRARGHKAFVTSADIPGRGRYWRVRIGPFESKWKAKAYRQKFEEEERMNTFVVRRRD